MTVRDDVTSRECQACHSTVPAAAFCGSCGADLEAPVDSWRNLLRPRVFAAAPREPVAVPRIASSLFPRLAEPSRTPFRLGMVALLVVIAMLSEVRANGPLGAVAVVGGPLLFLVYLWQADALRDIPRRALLIAMVTGAGLAVSWWLFTGRLLAGSYGVTTATGLALQNVLTDFGLAVTLGGAVLMLLPAVLVRLLRVPVHDALDGFAIGAIGALSYSVAGTITWMMPQIVAGLIDSHSAWRLFKDALVYGVVDPVTTVALGGLVGLSLWFRPNANHRGRARAALTVCTICAVVIYAAVWTVDAMGLPRAVELVAGLGLAVLALITVRFAVQTALLHEAPEPTTGDPVLCVHCEKVVPDMPFCAACGAAGMASSYSSRRRRRESPPVRLSGAGRRAS